MQFSHVIALVLVHSVIALRGGQAREPPAGFLGMSQNALWQQAWSSATTEGTPERAVYKRAEKLFKSWMQLKRQQEEETTFTDTTTLGIMARLTAGLDAADDNDSPQKVVTTTAENLEAKRANDKLMAMRQAAIAKLTEGMAESHEDVLKLAAVSTTSTTTTVTTTTNTAYFKLLAGVDRPEPSTMAAQHTTTTSTTTSTEKFVLNAAGRKTIAFISSGTFEFPGHQSRADTPAQQDDEDAPEEDHKDDYADSEAATDFEQYDN